MVLIIPLTLGVNFNVLTYVASNGRVISEYQIGKDLEGNEHEVT